MADNVTLTSAVRDSLLSLQSTTKLIDRTQSRLSSGLKVQSAVDDPVAFFQAKGLSDRATDFTEKKDSIDQGISTISAANDGVEGVDSLVRQLKGIANSLKAATASQTESLVKQYNDLRQQINNLAADSQYQGVNLINGEGETLTVEFSNEDDSKVAIQSVDLRVGSTGLNIGATDYVASRADISSTGSRASRASIASQAALDTNGSAASIASLDSVASLASRASVGSRASVASRASTEIAGVTYASHASVASRASTAARESVAQIASVASLDSKDTGQARISMAGVDAVQSFAGLASSASFANRGTYTAAGDTATLNSVINDLDSALTSLRTNSQTLGQNIALLNTRLDFTESYVNTLESGAGKLTLADINEEGANLLALQTRQQLGVQALSFAGQAEQSVLRLFG